MVYEELVFKKLMNKTIFNNKHTTPTLQYWYENLPSYVTTCESGIEKFILELRNVVSLLESRGVVLTDKFKIIWHAFELYRGAFFVSCIGRKQEAHEEDDRPTPSLTVDNILKFSLDKYTDRSCIDNHVWGSFFNREA